MAKASAAPHAFTCTGCCAAGIGVSWPWPSRPQTLRPQQTTAPSAKVLTIGGVNALSFPQMTRVNQLQIGGIQQLEKLQLPALQTVGRLELGNLPVLAHPDPMPIKDINHLRFHTCPKLNDVDWLPKTTQFSVHANICKSGGGLANAVKAWVQGSGSTAVVTQQGCN